MITKSLIDVDLEIKVKGYLIKLWSLANTNTMLIDKSQNEIYKLVGVSKPTQKKYNLVLVNAGVLEMVDGGMIIRCEAFEAITRKIKPTAETKEIVNDHLVIVNSHLESYNKKHKTDLQPSRETLNILLKEGLSKEAYQIGVYAIKNFEGVNDVNALVGKISGITRKPNSNKFSFTF